MYLSNFLGLKVFIRVVVNSIYNRAMFILPCILLGLNDILWSSNVLCLNWSKFLRMKILVSLNEFAFICCPDTFFGKCIQFAHLLVCNWYRTLQLFQILQYRISMCRWQLDNSIDWRQTASYRKVNPKFPSIFPRPKFINCLKNSIGTFLDKHAVHTMYHVRLLV